MLHPLAERIRTGILAFPATPFSDDGALDVAALERHVAFIARHRPVALVPTGGAGELFSLDVDEHDQVVRATVAAAEGLPVIAGVGGGIGTVQRQARNAEVAGASALLVLPPYLVNADADGLAAFVLAVAKVTVLPLIVYSRDNGVFKVGGIRKLADACPAVIGLKDGTGDLDLMIEMTRRTADRLVLINGAPTAEMLAAQTFAIGITAYSSAVFSFAPAIAQAFYDAVATNDQPRRDELLDRFYIPYSAIRRRRAGNAVSIIKAGLKVTGQYAGPVRPPLLDLADADCVELAKLIEQGEALVRGKR